MNTGVGVQVEHMCSIVGGVGGAHEQDRCGGVGGAKEHSARQVLGR